MATIERRETGDGVRFRAKVRIRGAPAQTATFHRPTDARRWAQRTEADLRAGLLPTREAQRRTFSELVERHERDVLAHRSPKARDRQRLQLTW